MYSTTHTRMIWGIVGLLGGIIVGLIFLVYSTASEVSRLDRSAAQATTLQEMQHELVLVEQVIAQWSTYSVGEGPRPGSGNEALLESSDRFGALADRLLALDPTSRADVLAVKFRGLWLDVVSLRSLGQRSVGVILNANVEPADRLLRMSLLARLDENAGNLEQAAADTRRSQMVLKVATPLALVLLIVVVVSFLRVLERSKRADELERIGRLKDEFFASVNHELRTPLTVVVGLAHELEERLPELSPRETAEFVGLLTDQADEVKGLVDDLLVATRTNLGSLPVSLEETSVFEQINKLLAHFIEPGWRVSFEGDDVKVLADAGRLRQVLRNLLSNIVRYGGRHVRVRVMEREGRVHVEVADDGDGLSETDAAQVFDPRYEPSAGPRVSGSMGLGLYVARQLMTLMGGGLTYRRQDEWTVFDLSLIPAAPTRLYESPPAVVHGAGPTSTGMSPTVDASAMGIASVSGMATKAIGSS